MVWKGSLHTEVRVLTVVQRYNSLSEPWLGRMLQGLGDQCVGVAGRTRADDGVDDPGIPFKRLRSRNVFHRILPKALREHSPMRPASLLAAFASQVKADRILCHYGVVAVEYAEAWDLLDLPLFVYFHGYDFMFDLQEQDGSDAKIHPPNYKDQILRLSQRSQFIANSQFARNRLIEAGVSPDRVIVNYLGVEPAPGALARKQGRPKILHIGRLMDCKGPDLTIQAFNLLRAQGCDAELIMVGQGPMRQRCGDLVNESPYKSDILLPGPETHQQVRRRLEEATVFTIHSQKGPRSNQEEAFGVAFLDAMAAGLPVVGGRSGGVPEIVRDGITGFLVDPGDVEAQADRLRRLIADPALSATMGQAGLELVRSEFSQQRSTGGLVQILHTV